MCLFVYLLINAQRFNSPLLHFFFTHTHKHDKAETLSLQICVCVFASPQLVTSGPSSPDRVCTGTSTASDTLPWLATGEFPPCCHARGHFSRVWKLQHKYWTTEIQSCKYPSVHDALFAGTFLTFLDFFLQCPLSFGDTERLSGLSHFPEISQFCCVDCFGTHLFISVLNLVSVYTPPVTSSAEKVVAATSSILPISGCFLSNSFFTPFIYRYSVYMHFITSRDLFIPSPFFWICISVSHSHC